MVPIDLPLPVSRVTLKLYGAAARLRFAMCMIWKLSSSTDRVSRASECFDGSRCLGSDKVKSEALGEATRYAHSNSAAARSKAGTSFRVMLTQLTQIAFARALEASMGAGEVGGGLGRWKTRGLEKRMCMSGGVGSGGVGSDGGNIFREVRSAPALCRWVELMMASFRSWQDPILSLLEACSSSLCPRSITTGFLALVN